jgi:DNA-binding response OmpR family regulator
VTSIFIIEDDPHFRSALRRELEGHGFEVRAVAAVDEALTALAESPSDIVLTDLRLGGQDGIDLLKRLPAVASRARTILMSAYATARDHQIATELGAVMVLVKPFTSSELLRTIQKAIDCETGFQGSIHGLSLIDMAQMFHLAQRSVSIRVHQPGAPPSKIHFMKGQIVHAEHRNLRGAQALRTILATPSGTLSTAALADDVPQTIDQPFEQLLLQSLSELDEEAHASRRRSRAARRKPGFGDLADLLGEPEAEATTTTQPDEDEPAPEPTDDGAADDTIYNASQSSVHLVMPTGASEELSAPPPLRPALSQACKELVLSIDAAVVCVIVSLETGFQLGAHQLSELDAQAGAAVAAATRDVFCGPAIIRLNALETPTGRDSRQEAQLTTPQHYFFAKLLPDERNAIGLLTRKTINIGMGWALLRASLAKVEPHLP